MKTILFLLTMLFCFSCFAQKRLTVKAGGSAGTSVVSFTDNAAGDSSIIILSNGTRLAKKNTTTALSGLDATSPVATGGTPTIANNTESGTLSNLLITGKNMKMQLKFTVNADRSVNGALCTITFASNNWTAAPTPFVLIHKNPGIGTVEPGTVTTSTLVLNGYNLSAGDYIINLLNIQ